MIKLKQIVEAGVFDAPDVGGAATGEEATEDPKSNMAVKKFDMLLKGKPGWEKVKELVLKMSDIKQADFISYLMTDAGVGETAKKKLKLKL